MLKSKQINDLAYRSYRTILNRDNDLNQKYKGVKAIVYNDPTASNNGTYKLLDDLQTWERLDSEEFILNFSPLSLLDGSDIEIENFFTLTQNIDFDNLADQELKLYINGLGYDFGSYLWFSDSDTGTKNTLPSSINNRLFFDSVLLTFDLDTIDKIKIKYNLYI